MHQLEACISVLLFSWHLVHILLHTTYYSCLHMELTVATKVCTYTVSQVMSPFYL